MDKAHELIDCIKSSTSHLPRPSKWIMSFENQMCKDPMAEFAAKLDERDHTDRNMTFLRKRRRQDSPPLSDLSELLDGWDPASMDLQWLDVWAAKLYTFLPDARLYLLPFLATTVVRDEDPNRFANRARFSMTWNFSDSQYATSEITRSTGTFLHFLSQQDGVSIEAKAAIQMERFRLCDSFCMIQKAPSTRLSEWTRVLMNESGVA